MSDKRNEDLKQFIIPENFMGESRLFQGQLKTRNVVEGGLISGVLAIFFWNVISVPITTKISLVIFLSAPLGLLGLFGVNGDPLSTFIKIFFSWRRKRGLMLFNNEARALKEAPIKLMMSEDGMGDKLRDFLDARKEKKAAERASQEMVEGKTFEFAPDSSLEGNYIDEDDDGDETPSGSAGNLHKTKRNQSFEESGLPLPDLGGTNDVELSNDDTNEMPDAEEPDVPCVGAYHAGEGEGMPCRARPISRGGAGERAVLFSKPWCAFSTVAQKRLQGTGQ